MIRIKLTVNRDWRFARGDRGGAELPEYDDSAWQRIGLPHSFDLPYFRTPEFYVGCGWYRKALEIDARWRGKRFFLEFDGVFQVAEVFVNGRQFGEHRGGYTGFCLDVTDAVHAGCNLLAVRVNNEWNPRLAPRAGEHIFSGGIYRDVHLLVADPLHVTWNGTFATTPHVSANSAIVNVQTEINNASNSCRQCTLKTSVVGPDGRVVTTMQSTRPMAPGQIVCFEQTSDSIAHPKLWHPDHPHLYTVHTQVFDGGTLVDEIDSPLGFRWFQWTADRGFFLNGQRLHLRGANVHQDHAGWGIAVTQAACRRDVQLIKDAGFNFIRGAHYPHHPAFADACDRLGVLFWSENCFWGKGGFGPEGYWNASAYPVNPDDFEPFEQSCKQTLREMIRINRNHPSIIAWSMTNEAFFTYNLDRAKSLVRDLVNLSHELDPTRPAAIGGAQRGNVDKLGDIAGYNGDGARLFIDPGIPNMVSEYGAINKPHDAYDPFWGDLQQEEFPWRCGQAIWCGFDYGSIAGKQGLKGILDHQRLPKRSWHWYRNEYRRIPPPPPPQPGTPAKLQLTADKTTIHGTDATDDCQIIVTVLDADGRHISNCPPVTLTTESGPGEFPTGRSITFDQMTDIKITAGQAAIAFRSYEGGRSAIRATSPGLRDVVIEITTIGDPLFVPGDTPLVADRPYTPPPMSPAAIQAMKNVVNVALNRPSRASSELPQHPVRLANDGDARSFWSAADEIAGHWWLVDLEGFYQISGTKISFNQSGNFRYIVELSENGDDWITAVDRSQTVRTDQVRNDIYPPGATARYVRIIFTALPPGLRANLCEVEVYGVLAVR